MERAAALARNPFLLWAAFVAAHLWLGLLNFYAPGLPMGDVTLVYKFWIDQALVANFWVGIDSVWVYPIVALVPMLAASAFGPDLYASTWLTMVMLLNAIAFGVLTGWGRSRDRVVAGWWWVGFLVLLGPIALARIDSISVAVAIVAVLLLATRPGVAGVLLAIATWIKVWPAALIAAAVVALRERLRVLAAVLVVTAAVLLIALLIGAGGNVLSFVTQQTGRGLQPESPIATIWMWMALAGVPGAAVSYDRSILSFAVTGPGADVAIAWMTPVLAIATLGVVALGVRALRAGASAADLLPPLALALTVSLIAFNKVGSPQFIGWIAAPVLLGLVAHAAGTGRSFRTPAMISLAIAALTQTIYPYLYTALLSLQPLLVAVLTVRNLLEFVLLGWAVYAIVTAPRYATEVEDEWLPGVWPFARDRDRL
ncbi:glycosyltransferase 87 family protein [Leifsonia sp. H3M29-4]|uniref:glycosyltransferase 87 family protein n=1 Tax=Salinibacterium metalliresistens TaxID=3031321 RepID=UPI0023DBC076|nr:glycosyltransferase 87 family protein [Salinibacterium metalliresistens]MDF1479667.1 glycosyltransferase 87 family protein [Salinibacterium metalliresistens]